MVFLKVVFLVPELSVFLEAGLLLLPQQLLGCTW